MERNCPKCNQRLEEFHNFCPECGNDLGSLKNRFGFFKEKVVSVVENKIDELKVGVSRQIEKYLEKIDTEENLVIGGLKIPEARKSAVKSALISFKARLSDSDTLPVEFQEWLVDLPKRIQEENCIVCFGAWGEDLTNIVVCKFCQSGGHSAHLVAWVETTHSCPLCRKRISRSDLIKVSEVI